MHPTGGASKVNQPVLRWRGPFSVKDSIPEELKWWPGFYLIECDSQILYVGIAESEGAFKRAKDHFRGQGDETGRWICQGREASKIHIWVAARGWDDQSSDLEKLLIFRLNPPANVNHVDKYEGKPMCIINEGDCPAKLNPVIESP
jgi:hypothetical protein